MTVKLHVGTEQVFSAFSKGTASCIKGKYLKVTSPYSLKTELIVVSISAAWKWVVILTIKNSLHDNAGESRCGPITVQARSRFRPLTLSNVLPVILYCHSMHSVIPCFSKMHGFESVAAKYNSNMVVGSLFRYK